MMNCVSLVMSQCIIRVKVKCSRKSAPAGPLFWDTLFYLTPQDFPLHHTGYWESISFPDSTFHFNTTWCWSRGSKHAHPAKRNNTNSIPLPAETPKSLSFRNSQPSGCKEEGVRDPQPCTAPTANLLASCLILTERGWGREIPHINSHHQSYRGRGKKPQSSPRFTSPPELQHRKNKDTHTHTHKERRETWSHLQLYSFIMFPDSNLDLGCTNRKHTEGVAVNSKATAPD